MPITVSMKLWLDYRRFNVVGGRRQLYYLLPRPSAVAVGGPHAYIYRGRTSAQLLETHHTWSSQSPSII